MTEEIISLFGDVVWDFNKMLILADGNDDVDHFLQNLIHIIIYYYLLNLVKKVNILDLSAV